MKDSVKKQMWLSSGIILGSIIVASMALYFLSDNLSTQAGKIIAGRAAIQAQTNAITNLANLKHDAPQAARYEAAIRMLIPGQYGLVGFAQWLNAIGSKHGVTTGFSLQGNVIPAAPGVAGTAGFSMDVTGSQDAVFAFLNDIESQAQGFLLSIDSFDLTKTGSDIKVTAHGILFFQT